MSKKNGKKLARQLLTFSIVEGFSIGTSICSVLRLSERVVVAAASAAGFVRSI